MEIFNNTTKVVRDDLKKIIQPGSRISIAAACFSIYAYQELKAQLEACEELRFIFTSPTFIAEKTQKERREFYIPRLRGPWSSGDLTAKTYSAAYDYPITTPSGKSISPTSGRSWITSKENMKKWIDEGRIWFGEHGDNTPRYKRYLSEMTGGIVPTTLWKYEDVGHSQEGRQEVKNLFNGKGYFDGPKPVRQLDRIL